MNVPRDYDLAGPLSRLWLWLALIAALVMFACPPAAEAQNYCSSSDGPRTLVTTPATGARFMLMNEACPGTPDLAYSAMEISALLLLTGRTIVHATDCTAATATSPVLCIEIDETPPDLYACELASGSVCDTSGEWSPVGGGAGDGVGYDEVLEEGSGLTKRAQVNFIGSSITCADNGGATRTDCTLTDDDVPDAGEVNDTALAAGAVDGGNAGEIADGSVTADDLGTDSVSTDELNATGVESELEAVLEVGQLQGGLAADQVDTITDIAAGLKSGADGTLITGTAGAADDCAKFNADGDLVSAGGACGVASGDITDVMNCSSGDCADIVAGATDSLDFSGVDSSGAGEGLILPQHATACAGGTAEGQVCWEADADTLYVGNGATLTEIGSGGGGSPEYHPDNYSPVGDTLQSDEFTSSLSLTWTDRDLDSAATSVTLGVLMSSFFINSGGTVDDSQGSTTTVPADSGADWYMVAKVNPQVTPIATHGCGISLITGGDAANPTEINSIYFRFTSSTAGAFEHLDHDDYEFTGSTSISTDTVIGDVSDGVGMRTRAYYLFLRWIDASEDIVGGWSWDGYTWATMTTDTTVDGYPVASKLFARDDAGCLFEWVRYLDTDVDPQGSSRLIVGGNG